MPKKKLISIRISELTARQITDLIDRTGDTQTSIVTIAIDRLWNQMKEEIEMTKERDSEVIINIVAHSGYAWEENISPGELQSRVKEIVDTHGDIQRVELLNDSGNATQNLYRE